MDTYFVGCLLEGMKKKHIKRQLCLGKIKNIALENKYHEKSYINDKSIE